MDHLPSHAELSEQMGKKLYDLEKENERLKEALFYLRGELLHAEKGSYYGALWRAIERALFP